MLGNERKRFKAKRDITKLRKRINEARKAYYVYSEPIMSDSAYDLLENKLLKLEKEYPEFDDPNSPTHTVGSDREEDYI